MEDVKTFFRFIPLAVVAGVLAGSVLMSDTISDKLHNQVESSPRDTGINESTQFHIAKCYFEAGFTHAIYYGPAILIPLYETLIYPIFSRCSSWMESRHKILVGMVALIARVATWWYKKRQRQDVLPNEHFFAERYYSESTDK